MMIPLGAELGQGDDHPRAAGDVGMVEEEHRGVRASGLGHHAPAGGAAADHRRRDRPATLREIRHRGDGVDLALFVVVHQRDAQSGQHEVAVAVRPGSA